MDRVRVGRIGRTRDLLSANSGRWREEAHLSGRRTATAMADGRARVVLHRAGRFDHGCAGESRIADGSRCPGDPVSSSGDRELRRRRRWIPIPRRHPHGPGPRIASSRHRRLDGCIEKGALGHREAVSRAEPKPYQSAADSTVYENVQMHPNLAAPSPSPSLCCYATIKYDAAGNEQRVRRYDGPTTTLASNYDYAAALSRSTGTAMCS